MLKKHKMHDSEVNLSVLPDVLQDLVIDFAFNLPKDDVLESLRVILGIVDMDLPFFFLKESIWSWHYARFLPNPVYSFMPIHYYNGRYSELFDDDALCCLLLGLDFRRRNVRMFGSRQRWLDRIVTCWRSVEPLSAFFKMLLRSKTPIMKHRSAFIRAII